MFQLEYTFENRKLDNLIVDDNYIGKLIIAVRTKALLTQKELAQRMNCKQPQVSRWERGEQIPSIKILIKIAKVTGTKIKISFEES